MASSHGTSIHTKMDYEYYTQRQEFIMCRARAPQTNAAVFMETNGSIPGSFGPSASIYIDSLDRFGSVVEARKQDQITVELWKQANDEVEKLFGLIDKVRAKMDKKSSVDSLLQPPRLDRRQCTWEQVLGEVQSAAARWSTTPKKSTKIITFLDKLGRNSDAFKSWLELIPAGDYGSSICGVFTLVVGAAGAFSKVGSVILETLAEIPEIMDDARRYIEIYGRCRDELLEKRTFELYLSIVKTLTHVMQFFADSIFQKVYQPLLAQSSYKSELLASCKDIKLRASRVKNEANICHQKRTVDMNHSIQLQHDVALDTNEKSSQTLRMVESLYHQLLRSSEARFVLGLTIQDKHAKPVPRQAIDAGDQKPAGNLERAKDNLERAKDMLETLQYDPDLILRDTETSLRLGTAIDEASTARAAALIRHPLFKAFMTESTTSSPLLVNGNEDVSSAEGLSPLSLVAAKLASISEQTESTHGLTLRYFCAEHGPYSAEHQSASSSPAASMMASLVGQLVSHMLSRSLEVDLAFLKPGQWEALGRRNLTAMCTVFYELVTQLPPETVLLCILDEVALYETGVARRDLDVVVRRLVRLVEGCDGIIFKLLVTCRGRVLELGPYFAGHTLEMDEDVEAEDSSTWQIASMN